MRLKTPITKEKIKIHLTYSAWKYILVAVLAVAGWGVTYRITAYRPPEDRRIDVYILSPTATQESADAFLGPLWRETVPQMEQVSAVIMTETAYTDMQLSAYLMAGAGDIYFLPEAYFQGWAENGAFLALDDLAADGALDVVGLDVTRGYVARVTDDGERRVTGERHLYGIPLDSLNGFMTGLRLDPRGMFAVIAANNHNDENVIPFLNALLKASRGE